MFIGEDYQFPNEYDHFGATYGQYKRKTYPFRRENPFDGRLGRHLVSVNLPKGASLKSIACIM